MMALSNHIFLTAVLVSLFSMSFSMIDDDAQFYIILSNSNQMCLGGKTCYNLSSLTTMNFPENSSITLFFLDGEHILNDTIILNNLKSVSMLGNGGWKQGPHWSVYQSTVVIRCTSDSILGFYINSVKSVDFAGLTIAGCSSAFYANNIASLILKQVSVQNCSKSGYEYISGGSSILYQSSFYQNCLNISHSYLHPESCDQAYHFINGTAKVSIFKSNFSMGKFLSVGLAIRDNGNIDNTGSVLMTDCLFYKNMGTISGGLYVVLKSTTMIVNNTKFIKNSVLFNYYNTGRQYAGGMTAFIDSDLLTTPYSLVIDNCLFEENNGGGAYIFAEQLYSTKYSIVDIKNTMFHKNSAKSGAGLGFLVKSITVALVNVSILGSTVLKTDLPIDQYSALVLYCYNAHISIQNSLTISNNEMTGLVSIACSIEISNQTNVLISNNNSPTNGGGMWMDETTHFLQSNSSILSFINNSASRYGGAIYSHSKPILYDFHYSASRCPVSSVNATFSSNNAKIAGNDIYGGQYFNCWSDERSNFHSFNDSFFQIINCDKTWMVFSNFSEPLSSHVSSNPFGVCFCHANNTVDCHNRSADMSDVYPGQWITLSLVTVGMCGGISPGVIVLNEQGLNVTVGSSNQQTSAVCKNFDYKLYQKPDNYNVSFTLSSGNDQFNFKDFFLTINVEFLLCPLGLEVKSGECTCNDVLNDASEYVQCSISRQHYPISRSGNNWLGYNNESNCTIAHKGCPFDYCNASLVELTLDDSDLQCELNRSGILCGQCQPGLSLMLGTNQCGQCDNKYIILVIVFIIAGIALVAFLLATDLTVSVGSINGLLFYANIVKLNEAVFFPNGVNVPVLHQFISWLNLDFGIQICFFNGLDGYWKTWLQFVFPAYIWLLIYGIIVGCYYYSRLSRVCGNNAVPVLATLILMSYTKLLLAIRNSLMVSSIECNYIQWNVWSIDGNIKYLTGKHIPLFIISLLVLLIALVYTMLVFSGQWLQRYSGKCCKSYIDPIIKFKPLIDAYTGPYKDKYRFWTGFLLILRIVLTAVFSYTSGTIPAINNYIIVTICIFIICISTKGVYRNWLINWLDIGYYMNLSMLSLVNILSVQMGWDITLYVTTVSVSMSAIVFIITLFVHIYLFISRKCGPFKCCHKMRNLTFIDDDDDLPLERDNDSLNDMPGSPARIVQRRESLIFDFDINKMDLIN